MALTQRNFQAYWKNPAYLVAKFALCIAGGLLIGFMFYKNSGSLQDTQNKLFVCGILHHITDIFDFFDRQSFWLWCFESPFRSSFRRCSSKFGLSMKSESAQAGCTTGPLSLSVKFWSSSHGTVCACRSSLSASDTGLAVASMALSAVIV
jgi:ABC-2 type transporter